MVARCLVACVGVLAGLAGQVQAATYVVDQAAPGAGDANPGTEEKPFKTIQHAADVAKAGDSVCVMAGKYDERVRVRAGGAEGQPITFRAMPRRSATVSGFDLEASYLRIEGFDMTAARPAVAVQLGGSHCEVLDNYIHEMLMGVNGTYGRSVAGGPRDYSAVAHIRVAYNKSSSDGAKWMNWRYRYALRRRSSARARRGAPPSATLWKQRGFRRYPCS